MRCIDSALAYSQSSLFLNNVFHLVRGIEFDGLVAFGYLCVRMVGARSLLQKYVWN